MSSVTSWHRLEGQPSSDRLVTALRAELADPLWLVSRQRQFGELHGEDAGSPIRAVVTASSGRITRYHPGVPGGGAGPAAASIDHGDRSLPLEALVEREPVWGQRGDGRLRVEAGLQFLRLLTKHGAGSRRATYVDHYGLTSGDLATGDRTADDAATDALDRAAAGRVPDGHRLHADLVAARGGAAELTALPAEPDVGTDGPGVLEAAREFLAWRDELIVEPGDGEDAWSSARLEHGFAVQAQLPGGRVVLVADEYHGGRLDWYHFRAETAADLGTAAGDAGAEATVRTVLPTPARYGGMPADRLWEFEDATVRFGGLSTGRTDLARLLLGEFALTYGNDWFVIPVDLPVGSVCRIDDLLVTDTFGVDTTVGMAGDVGRWTMFDVSAPGAPRRAQRLLFLPPVLLDTQESDPLEEVAFARDEMANVVWAIERRVAGASGQTVDRYEEQQRTLAAGERQDVPVDRGDADLIYRLQSRVPDHWHPFVPVIDPRYQLERRPVLRFGPDGTSTVIEPVGRILNAADPLRVEEEEVPRAGAVVTRQFQLTRWVGGRTVLWSGRRKRPGRGEASSGLRYDSAIHPG